MSGLTGREAREPYWAGRERPAAGIRVSKDGASEARMEYEGPRYEHKGQAE